MRDIPKQLTQQRIGAAVGWRSTRRGFDVMRFGKVEIINSGDDAVIIELHLDGLLLNDFGIEERILLSLAADIVPGLIVKRANLGRRAEFGRHIFTRAGAW